MPYERKTGRPYIKQKKEYWEEKSSAKNNVVNLSEAAKQDINFSPDFSENSWFESIASDSSGKSNIATRENKAALYEKHFKYSSIYDLPMPIRQSTYGSDHYIDIRETIELVEKSYFNIPIFGSTIDLLSEFADSGIFLEGGSKRSRAFFDAWLKTIGVEHLKSQHFLEHFRSGNVFWYRLSGKINRENFNVMSEGNIRVSDLDVEIPIRYILMSPREMVADIATSYVNPSYKQFLSSSLIRKLRASSNDSDKSVFDSLPEDAKKKININNYHSGGVYIEIDNSKLITSFYKKQDYEPFSVPMGFKVLDDLNAKLELKKIDQAISRTVENVILLVTAGQKESDGGYDPKKLQALQNIFKNDTIGRTLVADFTTKAEFIIPDLKKVVGPEKYAILNEDIKEGLQNIFFDDSNLGSSETKGKLFVRRLNNARKTFLCDFLIPEMKNVGKIMGFRQIPTPKFQQLDLKNEAEWSRVVVRLTELGILTPELAMRSLRNGELPSGSEVDSSQEEYVEKRKSGKYNPLLGGIPFIMGPEAQLRMEEGIPLNGNVKKESYITPNKGEVGVSRSSSNLENYVSVASIKFINEEINSLNDVLLKELKRIYKVKTVSDSQKQLARELTQRIVESHAKTQWNEMAKKYSENPSLILSLSPLPEVLEIQENYELEDSYSSAILYHSKQEKL